MMNVKEMYPKQCKVFADYFLGFSTREISGSSDAWRLYTDDNEFNALSSDKGGVGISGDLYASPDLKDICGTYYPLIGPYDTQDPDVAEYHVLLAKAAGLDGFLGEWEFIGKNRDKALLNLAKVGRKYGFQVGAHWCEYGHFAWQNFKDRRESIEAAKVEFIYLLQNIYADNGVKVDDRPLILMFEARAEVANSPKQAFFTPDEVKELRAVAKEAGFDPIILTRGVDEGMLGAVDGFFPWLQVGGSTLPPNEHWTMCGDRKAQVTCLKDFYEKANKLKAEGKITHFLGGLWQGFDDHKGQAWGTGQKRYIPRDNGQTLLDTWDTLLEVQTEIAMIATWNDWEEASQIEPSLELGYQDIEACAIRIAEWKQTPLTLNLLRLPERLFKMRKNANLLQKVNVPTEDLTDLLDQVGIAIASGNEAESIMLLEKAESISDELMKSIQKVKTCLFWEFSVLSIGLEPIIADPKEIIEVDGIKGFLIKGKKPEVKFQVSHSDRSNLEKGFFVGHLSFEYLDIGTDFIRVIVDHPDITHQIIANFRKSDTGRWKRASLDLVNIQFKQILPGGADFIIGQSEGSTFGIRLVRIDGILYLKPNAFKDVG